MRPIFFASLLVLLGYAGSVASAQDTDVYEIEVAAGSRDRGQIPVRVRLPAIHGVRPETVVTTLYGGDDEVPAQSTAVGALGEPAAGARELHFIVPSLKAGATGKYSIKLPRSFGKPDPKRGYRWIESAADGLELTFDGPVLRYVHPKLDETDAKTREQTYKPFHHVFSPDGKRIVTKGPGGQYTHHRGIYFGFNRVTYGDGLKCDVWHCSKPAHQAHEEILASEAGFVLGRHTVQIGWHGAKGEKFAEERRELTVYNVAGGQFIEFASVVGTADGKPIKLDGDPQHAGFHFRADNEVSEKTKSQTYFLRPDGKGKPGETRNWDAKKRDPKAANEPWKVMSFVLGDTRYSALYLDHPNNPKEARSSERDYGRFGSYFEYEITAEKPLRVNYRLILKEGEFTPDEAARLSADFTDPPQVTVKKL
jgi:hypothetical protein